MMGWDLKIYVALPAIRILTCYEGLKISIYCKETYCATCIVYMRFKHIAVLSKYDILVKL